ncbi:hypothetical protein, partial [Moorena bouillonii]|uniref:hypothetical protein n=1 Tax=Moorena bouillonii TaxID=207920 RepID=UPI001BE12017
SWEGSAVLGVPPMSDCRGSPHSLLHQDSVHIICLLSMQRDVTSFFITCSLFPVPKRAAQ